MTDVARMVEVVAVGNHLVPQSLYDFLQRLAGARHGLVEARREAGRRMRGGHAAVAVSHLDHVLGGQIGEETADVGFDVGFEGSENVLVGHRAIRKAGEILPQDTWIIPAIYVPPITAPALSAPVTFGLSRFPEPWR